MTTQKVTSVVPIYFILGPLTSYCRLTVAATPSCITHLVGALCEIQLSFLSFPSSASKKKACQGQINQGTDKSNLVRYCTVVQHLPLISPLNNKRGTVAVNKQHPACTDAAYAFFLTNRSAGPPYRTVLLCFPDHCRQGRSISMERCLLPKSCFWANRMADSAAGHELINNSS